MGVIAANQRNIHQRFVANNNRGRFSLPATLVALSTRLALGGGGGGGKGPLEHPQIYQVCNIGLTRILASIPLGGLFDSEGIPRGDVQGGIRLPIVEDFGVDARGGDSTLVVHTE